MSINRRQLLLALAARPPGSRELVSTPGGRTEYLRSLLRELCTGPRPSGSKAHGAGASIIQRELQRSLP
jgi:hypothetical protein